MRSQKRRRSNRPGLNFDWGCAWGVRVWEQATSTLASNSSRLLYTCKITWTGGGLWASSALVKMLTSLPFMGLLKSLYFILLNSQNHTLVITHLK
jgi:hypothetical protein